MFLACGARRKPSDVEHAACARRSGEQDLDRAAERARCARSRTTRARECWCVRSGRRNRRRSAHRARTRRTGRTFPRFRRPRPGSRRVARSFLRRGLPATRWIRRSASSNSCRWPSTRAIIRAFSQTTIDSRIIVPTISSGGPTCGSYQPRARLADAANRGRSEWESSAGRILRAIWPPSESLAKTAITPCAGCRQHDAGAHDQQQQSGVGRHRGVAAEADEIAEPVEVADRRRWSRRASRAATGLASSHARPGRPEIASARPIGRRSKAVSGDMRLSGSLDASHSRSNRNCWPKPDGRTKRRPERHQPPRSCRGAGREPRARIQPERRADHDEEAAVAGFMFDGNRRRLFQEVNVERPAREHQHAARNGTTRPQCGGTLRRAAERSSFATNCTSPDARDGTARLPSCRESEGLELPANGQRVDAGAKRRARRGQRPRDVHDAGLLSVGALE